MRYWKRVDDAGIITTVESYSHDLDIKGAVEISQGEYDTYLASLPKPIPTLSRDLAAEIDEIKVALRKGGIM